MIEHLNFHQSGRLRNALGESDIGITGFIVAAGMVMAKNNPGGSGFECKSENDFRIHCSSRNTTLTHLATCDDLIGPA